MIRIAVLSMLATTALALPATEITSPPNTTEKAATARWMASNLEWGFLQTTSTRSDQSTSAGISFANPYSFADVNGVPYFYASDLDASMVDAFMAKTANPRATLALSEAALRFSNGSAALTSCTIGAGLGDPENPPCARLVLSGTMSKVVVGSDEDTAARAALFGRHSSFKHYPSDHSFYVAKLAIDGVWLIDFYGGAAIIGASDYFAAKANPALLSLTNTDTPTLETRLDGASSPPFFFEKAKTARWMAANIEWGSLATTSTRSKGTSLGDPFGNPYAVADVNGQPYMYASAMDASFIDILAGKTQASFGLSEAATPGKVLRSCRIGTFIGDPENPPCSRLVISGNVTKVAAGSSEETTAKAALFARHPSFKQYPASHDFFIAKLDMEGLWLIDMFGGAALLSPEEYLAAN